MQSSLDGCGVCSVRVCAVADALAANSELCVLVQRPFYGFFVCVRVCAAFRGPFTKPALLTYLAILSCCIAAGANVVGTYFHSLATSYMVTNDFLVNKKTGLEFVYILAQTAAFVVNAVAIGVGEWVGAVVALFWQRQLIRDLHSAYFKSKVIYAANKMVPSLDNVDERITDDTRQLTQKFAALVFGSGSGQGFMQVRGPGTPVLEPNGLLCRHAFPALIVTVCTCGRVWRWQCVVQAVVNTAFASQYGWFPLVATYGVAVIGAWLVHHLMKPVVPMSYAVNKREGDFRFAHARAREFSECIVFYGGQGQECCNVDELFSSLYATSRSRIRKAFPTYCFGSFYTQFMGTIAFGIIAVYYLCLHGYAASTVASTYNIFVAGASYLTVIATALANTSIYISQFSDVAGIAHRVAHVSETLQNVLSTYEYFEGRCVVALSSGAAALMTWMTCDAL